MTQDVDNKIDEVKLTVWNKFICKFLAKTYILASLNTASLSVDSVNIQKYVAKIYLNYSYFWLWQCVSHADIPHFTHSASSVFVLSMCCFC